MKQTSTLRIANSGRGHIKKEAENEERRIEDGREAEYSTMELAEERRESVRMNRRLERGTIPLF